MIKNLIKRSIASAVLRFSRTSAGLYVYQQIIDTAMNRKSMLTYQSHHLIFVVPNWLTQYRIDSFAIKEPETLEWIDSVPKDSVLWDVGANIGFFSIYAAKTRNCRVYAFEPSVFNLELLARNIFENGLADQICIIPVALSNKLGTNQMHMTTTDWGGALSTFGQDFGWDGKAIRQVFKFQTLGLSMEDATQKLAIPQPDYIKMDVDGLEHIILMGGAEILRGIKEILIEINDDFHEQAEQCQQLLGKAGLVLKEKCHSQLIATNTKGFQNSYNQIWVRL